MVGPLSFKVRVRSVRLLRLLSDLRAASWPRTVHFNTDVHDGDSPITAHQRKELHLASGEHRRGREFLLIQPSFQLSRACLIGGEGQVVEIGDLQAVFHGPAR
jgi:hypothetical protein